MIDDDTKIENKDILIDRMRKSFVVINADPLNNAYTLMPMDKREYNGEGITPTTLSKESLISKGYRKQ